MKEDSMIHIRHSIVLLLFIIFAFLFCFALLFSSPSGQDKPVSPVETITAESIRHHVYFLASDALEGRYTGSKGYQIAAQYGESQFRAAGLKPIVKQGGQFAYLQPVPVVRRASKAEPELVVRTPKGETKFLHAKDFRWLDGEILSCENKPLPVVFVGYGIHEPAAGWDDFKGLDVRNKVMIMLQGAPMKNGKPVLPEALHKKYASESSWQVKLPAMFEMPAAGILVPASESMLKAWDQIPMQTNAPQISLNDRNADAWNILSIFAAKPEIVQALLAGQKQALPKPNAKDASKVKGFDLNGVTLFLTTSFQDEEVPTWNVVGLVDGTDSVLKNEYVAVSAHLDHLSPRKDEIMNGADDNASGCAGLMEVAEAVAQKPFKRSVVFILFAGEEKMVLGSRYFISACPVARDKIIADINLDMIGRTDKESEADRALYALDADNVRPEFKKLIMEVNDRTIRWPLKYDRQPKAGSDNLVFNIMNKTPGVFFWSGPHADYHRSTDDADKIDYEKAEKISRLGYELTKELASGAGF
jgi:hypothetical protein